jgi:hypothetical protein
VAKAITERNDFGFRNVDFGFRNADTMEERIRRIGRIETDFFDFAPILNKSFKKKSVCISPICLIRSSIVSAFRNPKSTIRNRITFFKQVTIKFFTQHDGNQQIKIVPRLVHRVGDDIYDICHSRRHARRFRQTI